ncbi:hypothetical protein PMAYCL1PPCAC_28198, partial [Pristionchus mayeri]
ATMGDSTPDNSQPDPDTITMFVGQVPKSFDATQCREIFEVYGPVHQVVFPIDSEAFGRKDEVFITFYHRKDALSALDALHNVKTLPGMTKPIQMRPADEESGECLGPPLDSLFAPLLIQNPRLIRAAETMQQDVFEAVLYDVLTGGANRLATDGQPANNADNQTVQQVVLQKLLNTGGNMQHQQWINQKLLQPARPKPAKQQQRRLQQQGPTQDQQNAQVMILLNQLQQLQHSNHLAIAGLGLNSAQQASFAEQQQRMLQQQQLAFAHCMPVQGLPVAGPHPRPIGLVQPAAGGAATAAANALAEKLHRQSTIFVTGMPDNFSDGDLRTIFASFCTVTSAFLSIYQKNKESPRKVGSISFDNPISAGAAARQMNGLMIGDNKLEVKLMEECADILPYLRPA